MKINDVLSLSWRNLMRRKTRTFLTILSVVIGIVSIILMLSFGFGIQKQQEASIKMLGNLTTVSVNPMNYFDPNSDGPVPTSGIITDKVLEEIKQNPLVKGAFGVKRGNFQISTNTKDLEFWNQIQIFSIKDLKENGVTLQDGTPIPDLRDFEYFVTAETYPFKVKRSSNDRWGEFQDMEPLYDFDFANAKINFLLGYKDSGQSIFDGGKTYEEVKAVFRGKLARSDYLESGTIIVSESTAEKLNQKLQKLYGETQSKKPKRNIKIYDEAKVFAKTIDDVQQVIDNVKEKGLNAYSNIDFINAEKEQARVIQLVLGGIGSIALLVSAIGISNTMLMSIHERTKEIGVMKVIGAQVRDVRRIFLIEAMLIGVLGGIIGVLISIGASSIANNIANNSMNSIGIGMMMESEDVWKGISYIPIWLPLIAVAFSGLIGLLAGYLPARRATKLSAIEAIRTN